MSCDSPSVCRSLSPARVIGLGGAANPDVPELDDDVLGPGRLLVLVAVWGDGTPSTVTFSTGSDIFARESLLSLDN